MKRMTLIVLIVVLSATSMTLTAQDEGGGQSGADFLLSVPATRADAMGGVVDGQGNPLEGILFNPAVLMLNPEFRFLVSLAPLPNDVTNSQLSIGVPIADSMVAASVQLLSAGDFTYINNAGQASGTVTLFDAAVSVGYAQYVLDSLAVGATAKGVYRSLGAETAFAMGADLGAAWWFETPHIGQAPKPPTLAELEARLERELVSIETERTRRTRAAAGDVADLREEKEKLEGQIAGFEEALAAAEPDSDTSRTDERLAVARQALAVVTPDLAAAEAAAADDLAEVESWYTGAVAAARRAHSARLADLREVERERARLFAVLEDPETTLEPGDLDVNIDDAIARSRAFLSDRRSALTADERDYRRTRLARRADVEAQIARYEEQIAEVVGPEAQTLSRQITRLQGDLTALEAAEGDNSAAIRTLRSEISTLQKQLDGLESDPWVRRLRGRIADKMKAIAAIDADLESRAAETEQRIANLAAATDRDVERFEVLRVDLQTSLRRARLRSELGLLDARNERATAKALAEYEAEEQAIYQRLLAAMYQNEEKIFSARLETARRDSQNRAFEFDSDLSDERESVEDDFAFAERFLQRQIADLKRAEPADEARISGAEAELAETRTTYRDRIDELDRRERTFSSDERARLDSELSSILDERRKVRLIYLQTDDPYRNTAITLAIRNLGTNLTFIETGYPMPRSAALGLSYGLVNTDLHRAMLSTELEMPLYGEPALSDLEIGVGAEYTFAQFASLRAGYAFGSVERSFSLGFAVDFALGFTSYSVEYAFRPLPDYGLQHTIGVSIAF